MTVYLSSDTHFGHNNLVVRGQRPFASCEEHDETIINNFNSVLNKSDTLWLLGDIVWNQDFSVLKRIKGDKFIIKGNHDNTKALDKAKKDNIICNWHEIKCKKFISEKHGEVFVSMCHYPLRSWDRQCYGSYHAYGHCHGTIPNYGKSMDVGLERNNYFPVSLDTVVEKLKDRERIEWE